jgi:hypothetical protein
MPSPGDDVRAIVSIDPGIKNFAYTVLITSFMADKDAPAVGASSVKFPTPGFLVWRMEKFNLVTDPAIFKDAMYAACAARLEKLCAELRRTFGEHMRIDALIEMQMQTNTYTFPLVYYLLGFFKRCVGTAPVCFDTVYTIAPRTKLAARVVAAVWRACYLQFSTSRHEGAHVFNSSTKAISLTFADAFIAAHGSTHVCGCGNTLASIWNSPRVRTDKRDDLADSLLQGVAMWAAEREIASALQTW